MIVSEKEKAAVKKRKKSFEVCRSAKELRKQF